MMYSLGCAALGTLFTFAMTTLGAATVFLFDAGGKPRSREAMLGFAGGVMTAASVWSLLLPAIEQASATSLPPWLPAAAGVASGAAFLAALDALAPRLKQKDGDEAHRRNALLFTAITMHNIPEGMAVGLAFALAADGGGMAGAAALALGIGLQNFPEGAAIALPARELGAGKGRAFALGTLSGAVEPLFGVLVVPAAGVGALMPWLLSFAAGAMLYVVVVELTPRADSRGGVCGYMAGFLVMMILDVALG